MKITTVDTHTEGQATRIIVSGLEPLGGATMDERRREFRFRYDRLRTALVGEPRGHAGMLTCALIDPCSPDADFGVLFMHNAGYLDVAGHAVMGVATALFETGIIDAEGDSGAVVFETPAGLVHATVCLDGGRVRSVTVRGVPAWIGLLGASLEVPGHGEIIVDAGYGGSHFVWAWAEHLGVELEPGNMPAVLAAGRAVLDAANERLAVRHPETGERVALQVATILDAPHHELPALRNVHVWGPSQFDRSPGASGASARLAVMHARGEILTGDEVVVESPITHGLFRARVVEETRVGARGAVITEVTGTAHVTGLHDFVFDADDRLNEGFLVGDAPADQGVEEEQEEPEEPEGASAE